jgi:Zn-dependent protease with chaperone function
MVERIEARRTRARRLAVVLYGQAAVVLAAYVSLLVLVVVVGIVRFLWLIGQDGDTMADVASTGALVAGAVALVTFALTLTLLLAWWWVRGGAVLLRRLRAHELPEADPGRLRNLVEELSLGLGIEPPTVRLVDDPIINATAFRARGRRYVVVATGASELPRPELQALIANVLARLVTSDTDAITRALLAVNAADRFTRVGYGLGTLCFGVVWLGAELGTFPITWALMGALFIGLSILTSRLLDSRADRLAAEADAAADLTTVELTKDPAALASVMRRLASDTRESTRVPERYGRLFFKHVLVKVRVGDDLFDDDVATIAAARGGARRAHVQRALTDRAAEVERIHGLTAPG